MRCELVSLLSQDLESGLFCCHVPKRLLAMCLEFTALELWVFLVYPFVFCQTLVQGSGCVTDESWEGCSQCSWDAAAFWVPPEELRNVHWHQQNTVISASWDYLGFLYLLSWLLPCAHWFLCFFSAPSSSVPHEEERRMSHAVMCPAHCELWWDMVSQSGEKRCQQGSFSSCSPAELCRQKDGFFQLLLQGTDFNEHNVQRAHCVEWRCHRSVHWRGLGNLGTRLTHNGLSGEHNSF